MDIKQNMKILLEDYAKLKEMFEVINEEIDIFFDCDYGHTMLELWCSVIKKCNDIIEVTYNKDSGVIEILQEVVNELEQSISDITEIKGLDLAEELINAREGFTTLKDKLDYMVNESLYIEEYMDTWINPTFLNIDITTEFNYNSIIYITKLQNIEKIACLPTNGDVSAYVDTNKNSVLGYSFNDYNYQVYINGGMMGIYIFDGAVNETSRLDCPYYLGFDENNNMIFVEGLSTTITSSDLTNRGIVNCLSGFAPLVIDHTEASYSSLEAIYSSNEIASRFIDALEDLHPRQILAQDDDNNFYIISVFSRINNSLGVNYAQMKEFCLNKGYKNAFNMDGGGSTQVVINNSYVFYPSQELDTNNDRTIPSVLGFKLKGVD